MLHHRVFLQVSPACLALRLGHVYTEHDLHCWRKWNHSLYVGWRARCYAPWVGSSEFAAAMRVPAHGGRRRSRVGTSCDFRRAAHSVWRSSCLGAHLGCVYRDGFRPVPHRRDASQRRAHNLFQGFPRLRLGRVCLCRPVRFDRTAVQSTNMHPFLAAIS